VVQQQMRFSFPARRNVYRRPAGGGTERVGSLVACRPEEPERRRTIQVIPENARQTVAAIGRGLRAPTLIWSIRAVGVGSSRVVETPRERAITVGEQNTRLAVRAGREIHSAGRDPRRAGGNLIAENLAILR